VRSETAAQAVNAFSWLSAKAAPEWVQFFASDAFPRLRMKGQIGAFANAVKDVPEIQVFLKEFQELIGLR
jgi:hypothetical protein